MKLRASLLLAALTAAVLSGCGESTKPAAETSTPAEAPTAAQNTTPPPPAPPAPPPAPADAPPAIPSLPVEETVAEVQKQATEAAATAQKQASAVYENLSSQLAQSVQSSPDSLLKNITSELGERVSKLGASLQENEDVQSKLTSGLRSLLDKNDLSAVESLGGLTDAKLTPDQTTLAKDVYNAAAALVTQRNFSSLEGLNSDVANVANSVLKGNYTEALPPLQKIWTQAQLTDKQKNLLSGTFDKYAPGWRDGASKIQQGLDALKGLNK